MIRDKKINRKIASQKWFVTETGKALPKAGIGKTKRTWHYSTLAHSYLTLQRGRRPLTKKCTHPPHDATHRPLRNSENIEIKGETIEKEEEKKRAGGRNHLRVTWENF